MIKKSNLIFSCTMILIYKLQKLKLPGELHRQIPAKGISFCSVSSETPEVHQLSTKSLVAVNEEKNRSIRKLGISNGNRRSIFGRKGMKISASHPPQQQPWLKIEIKFSSSWSSSEGEKGKKKEPSWGIEKHFKGLIHLPSRHSLSAEASSFYYNQFGILSFIILQVTETLQLKTNHSLYHICGGILI